MHASRSKRFGEKFGRSRSGRASSVLTASRRPDARSTTRDTTENAPRPITSQTSNLRSKSRGVPNASPTVLDSASSAAPRSPWSSVGGAAVSRSQLPLATPRGRFWEWCEGIFVASLRRRLEPFGGVRGRARRSKKAGRGSPGLGLLVLSPSAPGAQPYAARASWASSRSPQISFRPAGGLRHEGTETATHRILLHPNCFLFSRAIARDRLVLAPYQITVPREAAGESKGRRSQRPVLGGRRAVVAAPPILRRLARHQNLGPPS